MRRSLLALSLLAALPGLARAQEPKLVNCRTLEAAGNFVGPDEVIVDDMVCQKAKPGADAAKAQSPKPVLGTTISDAPVDSVVDAAKAAGKRVAARKEKEDAEAQKDAAQPAPAAPSAVATPTSTTPPATAATPSAPPPSASPAASGSSSTIEPPAPVVVSKPQLAAPTPKAAAPAGPGNTAAAQPVAPSEPAAPTEIVISSAPSSAPAATSSATERTTSPPAEVVAAPVSATPQPAPQPAAAASSQPTAPASAEPVSASPSADAVAPPRPTDALPPSDPTHPATSSGFYDANAPKRSASAAPETNSGFATAEQVNAGLVPGATSVPAASQPAAAADSANPPTPSPDAEPHPTSIAASRVGFDDPDRDRAVKLGDFAQPKEVSPDPSTEHRTSVDPSDADGFQDRQRPECTKNISLGGLKGERLVLGVPTWAVKWIEKNEKRMPEICFSETPMKSARNYLIVFSTPAGAASSKDAADALLNPAKPSTASGVGTFTTSFGSTWHYSYDRNVGTTVLTQDDADEPHAAPGQVLYATAYTEEGVPVSQRWPGQVKKELKPGEKNQKKIKGETEALERVSSDLLSQMVEDIAKF